MTFEFMCFEIRERISMIYLELVDFYGSNDEISEDKC